MGITPDQSDGPSDEEETQYEDRGPAGDNTGDPVVEGALRRVTKALRFFVGGAARQVLQAKNVPADFDEIDLSGIANGQGLAYNSTSKQFLPATFGGGGSSTTALFEAYDGVGGTDFTSGYTDIPLDTEREKSSEFTYTAGNAEVEIATAGKFVVIGRVGYLQNGGNNRSEVVMRLMLDTGSGYAFVPGSEARGYSRQNAAGCGTMLSTVALDLAVGDKLKMQADKASGVGVMETLPNGSSLMLFSPQGEKGDTGATGPAGDLTAGDHRDLDQLVHSIAESSFEEVSYTGNKVDSIIVWTNAGKTQKVREELFTYTGNNATTIVTKQYDGAGLLVETLTETLAYTGNKLDTITRILS